MGATPVLSSNGDGTLAVNDDLVVGEPLQTLVFDADNNLVPGDPAPGTHTHLQSEVTGLVPALAAKAPLDSPALTGTPSAPTAAQGANTTQLATTAFVRAEFAAFVQGAPSTLDTIDEIAAALGDDANLATTLTTLIGQKLAIASNLNDLADKPTARTNLGLGTAALLTAPTTNGTAEAGKPLVPDTNIDVLLGLRNVVLTGTIRTTAGTFSTPALQVGSASAGWYTYSPPGGGGALGGRWGNQRNVSLRPTHVGGSVGVFLGQGAFGEGGLTFDTTHSEAALSANAAGLVLDANNTLRVSNGSSSRGHLRVNTLGVQSYTVATLPTAGTAGRVAFASNGRKSGEGSGSGTGVPVWDDGTNWKTFYDNSTVAA